MESNANLTSYLVESLNGITTVKSYNAEREVFSNRKRFVKLLKYVFKKESWPIYRVLLKWELN